MSLVHCPSDRLANVAGAERRGGHERGVGLRGTKDGASNPRTGRDERLNKKDDGCSQILIAHCS